ncbi:uncharacterized protein EURHEDRAFT_544026 [Aspergillus ruber CBS 135680]|uniref:Uncharacterized protein n=1 Tax=Aspergillus ruber (strain CBS 135680) TaxID=1388766 RepID=A0A017S8E4_ASPRC|nr:uncharacterized protein EURHEDRAFT_544026 [Aspergillus ruber CBS 135680]EYE92455.1 hypothetical protein EURHEDRAFT_544026 [Aspergillus ruber CBS 135680]
MMVTGMWANGGQSSQSAAIDLTIHYGTWDASTAEACSSCAWPIPTYQAILLHIIFTLIYKGRDSLGFDLEPFLPPSDMELLECLVS